MNAEPNPARPKRALLKRWWFWLAVIVLAAIAFAGAYRYATRNPSLAVFLKVKSGMTRDEVDQIVRKERSDPDFPITWTPEGTVHCATVHTSVDGRYRLFVEFVNKLNEPVARAVDVRVLDSDPDDTVWERIQYEYSRLKRRLGW
jgi:hypothetical protein